MLENLTKFDFDIIDKKAELIERDDNILSIPNEKYVERYIFYCSDTNYYYVKFYVLDNNIDKCYFSDGQKSKIEWQATDYYDSILTLVSGMVYK